MTKEKAEIRTGILSETILKETVQRLAQGGVIAYPTETVYGLGVDPFQPEAVKKLYRLKGRLPSNPVSLLIPSPDSLADFVVEVNGKARILMNKYWPGPLTLLFAAASAVPESVTGGTGKVGIRISANPFCSALLSKWGKSLVSTSANPSAEPPAMTAIEVMEYFKKGLNLILDGGRAAGVPSTILDVSIDPPLLIREGTINRLMLEEDVGYIERKQ